MSDPDHQSDPILVTNNEQRQQQVSSIVADDNGVGGESFNLSSDEIILSSNLFITTANESNNNRIKTRTMNKDLKKPLKLGKHLQNAEMPTNSAFSNGIIILNHKSVYEWSVQDVGHWLELNNFGSYVDLFCNQHRIDGRVLVHLTADDLRSDPLKLTIFGDIKRFCLAFDHLRSIFVPSHKEETPKIFNSMLDYYSTEPFSNNSAIKETNGHSNRYLTMKQSLNNNNNNNNNINNNINHINNRSTTQHQYQQNFSYCSINNNNSDEFKFNNNNDDPEEMNHEILNCDEDVEPIHQRNNEHNLFTTTNEFRISHSDSCSSSSSLTLSSSVDSSDKSEDYESHESGVNSTNNMNYAHHTNNNNRIQTRIVPTITTESELANLISTTHLGYYSSGTAKMAKNPQNIISGPKSMHLTMSRRYSSQNKHRYSHHNNHYHKRYHHHHHHRKELKPEAWKAIVALIYFFSSTWITAIVMVIVHDRVPDMDTYPPLPDLILDNLPLIPWAFSMTETCGLILFSIWALILIFHKHRFILLRRMFSLFGSVFLIRCFTMVITSLSVPGRHLQCKARPYGTWTERLYQAYMIWQGGGMAIRGVRSCGDYMFSGHTVVLTMLNFFITEYTPPGLYLIHTMSWVLNLFGVFFILAAHEHYSIDVFIAFYISTRLFLYYHTLANNRALYQSDRHRTRIWFPLFSFFECGVTGIVPNEYEIPFRRLKDRLVNYLVTRIGQISLIRIIFDNDWGFDNDLTGNVYETTTSNNYSKVKTQ